MKYNIEHIIKGLEKAKKAGKNVIDEKELIRIATPQINDIDGQIKLIERGINKVIELKGDSLNDWSFNVSYVEANELTGIPRRTFYRWEKNGIINRDVIFSTHTNVDLKELKDELIRIRKARG